MHTKDNPTPPTTMPIFERLQLIEEQLTQLVMKSESYSSYIAGSYPEPSDPGKTRPSPNGMSERLALHFDTVSYAIDILNAHIDRMSKAL